MAFNKQQNQIGTLLQTPFKRVAINDESYFTKLVYFIHANPQTHGLINDFRKWNWSSYHKTIQNKSAKLEKTEILNWFYGREAYIKYHAVHHLFIMEDDR